MADLIAVVFPSEAKAEEVREKILGMQKDYLIDIGDAAIATKTDTGKVKLNQLMNTTAAGAAGGSFWGLLVGVLFLNPLLGVAVGARRGAVAGALTDVGVDDKFMKGLAEADLKDGEAVLFVLVKKVTGDKVLAQLEGVGGRVLQTSLDHTREEALRKALAGQAAARRRPAPDPAPASRASAGQPAAARASGSAAAKASRSAGRPTVTRMQRSCGATNGMRTKMPRAVSASRTRRA